MESDDRTSGHAYDFGERLLRRLQRDAAHLARPADQRARPQTAYSVRLGPLQGIRAGTDQPARRARSIRRLGRTDDGLRPIARPGAASLPAILRQYLRRQ